MLTLSSFSCDRFFSQFSLFVFRTNGCFTGGIVLTLAKRLVRNIACLRRFLFGHAMCFFLIIHWKSLFSDQTFIFKDIFNLFVKVFFREVLMIKLFQYGLLLFVNGLVINPVFQYTLYYVLSSGRSEFISVVFMQRPDYILYFFAVSWICFIEIIGFDLVRVPFNKISQATAAFRTGRLPGLIPEHGDIAFQVFIP